LCMQEYHDQCKICITFGADFRALAGSFLCSIGIDLDLSRCEGQGSPWAGFVLGRDDEPPPTAAMGTGGRLCAPAADAFSISVVEHDKGRRERGFHRGDGHRRSSLRPAGRRIALSDRGRGGLA
jgi:hypothetical protein